MVLVGVEEVAATDDDVLHDGCGEPPEGDLGACMEVGREEEELVPRTNCDYVVRLRCNKEGVVGMEEGMEVDTEEGMGVGMEEGMGVGVERSMLVDMKVRK